MWMEFGNSMCSATLTERNSESVRAAKSSSLPNPGAISGTEHCTSSCATAPWTPLTTLMRPAGRRHSSGISSAHLRAARFARIRRSFSQTMRASARILTRLQSPSFRVWPREPRLFPASSLSSISGPRLCRAPRTSTASLRTPAARCKPSARILELFGSITLSLPKILLLPSTLLMTGQM